MGRRAFVAWGGALAGGCIVASCASIGGLSGGGGPDAGDGDAAHDSPSRTDTGSLDSAFTDAPDSSDPPDAADSSAFTDATAPPDTAPPPCTANWCACQVPAHKVCNDFDEGLLFNDPAWPLSPSPMSTITLDDGGTATMRNYTSPPYSAHFSVAPFVGTGVPDAVIPFISYPQIGAVLNITCALDLLILNYSPMPQAYVQPFLLRIPTTGLGSVGEEDAYYQVSISGANAGITEQDNTAVVGPLPLQVGWTRYWFSFVPPRPDAGTGYQFLAGFGDAGASVVGMAPAFINTGFTVQVGIPASQVGNGGWDVLIDDVTCDW